MIAFRSAKNHSVASPRQKTSRQVFSYNYLKQKMQEAKPDQHQLSNMKKGASCCTSPRTKPKSLAPVNPDSYLRESTMMKMDSLTKMKLSKMTQNMNKSDIKGFFNTIKNNLN